MNTANKQLAKVFEYRFIRNEDLLTDYPDYNFFSDFGIGPVDQRITSMNYTHYNKQLLYHDVMHSNQYNNIRWFEILDKQYPNSVYILNVRDLQRWISSRAKWETLLLDNKRVYAEMTDDPKYKDFKNIDDEFIFDLWREDWTQHIEFSRQYFDGYDKFLEFNIDYDNSDKLKSFLSDKCDFGHLDMSHWRKYNETVEMCN